MRRLVGPALLGATVFAGCKGGRIPDASPPAVGGDAAPRATAPLELPPALTDLGELVHPTTVLASGTVAGETGGAVPLADGAMLVVAPGAYRGSVAVRLQRVELDLARLRADVKGGVAYLLATDRDVDSFAAPVTLQIKRPEGRLAAVIWQDGGWKPLASGEGPIAVLAIPHFSRGLLGFVEWLRARTNATDEVILDGDSVEAKKRARLLASGNESAKTFYGVGDKLDSVRPQQLCGEIMRLIEGLPKDGFAFPPGSGFRDAELGLWLIDGRIPSLTTDPLWKMTEGYMEPIRNAVVASPSRLAPADMLKLCIDATDGNVPVAVMACHNFLKEVTYAGREQPIDRMKDGYAAVVSKLMPLRTDDVAPSGYYDKMGPIYHVFAAMAAGVWSQHPVLGNAAASGEALLRIAQRGGDRPDPEKSAADDCGVDAGWAIRKHEAGSWRGSLPPPPATPWKVDEPPPSPIAAPATAPVRDAGMADGGGGPPDGGSPESTLAQLDAGPAPSDQRKSWDGAWHGKAKSTITMSDGLHNTTTEDIALDVTSTADVVTLTRKMGAQSLTMDLKKTPSNPNAAVGQGDRRSSNAGFEVTVHYHIASFLHTDGRLYVAGRVNITSTGPGPEGPVTVTMLNEFLAILSH